MRAKDQSAHRPHERLLPDPKLRLREQVHEVARFRQCSLRIEEALQVYRAFIGRTKTRELSLQFVVQYRQAVNRRRLDAENQSPERNGQRAGGFDDVHFCGGEVAFRTDPNASGAWQATVPALEITEILAGVPAVASQ